jgi:hypothetical protein
MNQRGWVSCATNTPVEAGRCELRYFCLASRTPSVSWPATMKVVSLTMSVGSSACARSSATTFAKA